MSAPRIAHKIFHSIRSLIHFENVWNIIILYAEWCVRDACVCAHTSHRDLCAHLPSCAWCVLCDMVLLQLWIIKLMVYRYAGGEPSFSPLSLYLTLPYALFLAANDWQMMPDVAWPTVAQRCYRYARDPRREQQGGCSRGVRGVAGWLVKVRAMSLRGHGAKDAWCDGPTFAAVYWCILNLVKHRSMTNRRTTHIWGEGDKPLDTHP